MLLSVGKKAKNTITYIAFGGGILPYSKKRGRCKIGALMQNLAECAVPLQGEG